MLEWPPQSLEQVLILPDIDFQGHHVKRQSEFFMIVLELSLQVQVLQVEVCTALFLRMDTTRFINDNGWALVIGTHRVAFCE